MKRVITFFVLTFAVFAGCATRDSSGLLVLHESTVSLGRLTETAVEGAVALVDDNSVQKACEGDIEALEGMLLVQSDSHGLIPADRGLPGAVAGAGHLTCDAAGSLGRYTGLLSMLTEPSGATEAIWSIASIPLSGPLASAATVLVEQGVLELDTEHLRQAMLGAAPGVDSLCAAASSSLGDIALAVRAAYQDMSARLVRRIVATGNPEAQVRELLALNSRTTAIIGGLEKARAAWTALAEAHRETAAVLGSGALSVSLIELAERMEEFEHGSH
ncbi:MAG: hypothetical protein R6V62_03615 [Candidatus Fermentibacteraceae bacterium]